MLPEKILQAFELFMTGIPTPDGLIAKPTYKQLAEHMGMDERDIRVIAKSESGTWAMLRSRMKRKSDEAERSRQKAYEQLLEEIQEMKRCVYDNISEQEARGRLHASLQDLDRLLDKEMKVYNAMYGEDTVGRQDVMEFRMRLTRSTVKELETDWKDMINGNTSDVEDVEDSADAVD